MAENGFSLLKQRQDELDKPLSSAEQDEFDSCEATIQQGLDIFYNVGQALLTIREKRLHRKTHHNFSDYLRERWGLSRQRASQIMISSGIVENLSKILDKNVNGSLTLDGFKIHESTLFPLRNLEPETQQTILLAAINTAPDGKLTASWVKSTIESFEQLAITGGVDTGNGEITPLNASITQQEAERKQRQRDHIAAGSPWKALEHGIFEGQLSEVLRMVQQTLDSPIEGKIRVVIYVEKVKKNGEDKS